jgi:hypothetical protein
MSSRTLKRWTLLSSTLLLLCILPNCATVPQIVYKDVPDDCVVVKRDTLRSLIGDYIIVKGELMECLERARK